MRWKTIARNKVLKQKKETASQNVSSLSSEQASAKDSRMNNEEGGGRVFIEYRPKERVVILTGAAYRRDSFFLARKRQDTIDAGRFGLYRRRIKQLIDSSCLGDVECRVLNRDAQSYLR
jgi:hypothetical protein